MIRFKDLLLLESAKLPFNRSTIFYHGSAAPDIKSFEFKPSKRLNGMYGTLMDVDSKAIFFTPNYQAAEFFAKDRARLAGTTSYRVYKCKLNVKNPLDLRDITNDVLNILLEAGFDAWEEFGVMDNGGFMYKDTIEEWEREHGRPMDENDSDWYQNVDNLRAEPSQFWAVADRPQVVENLKTMFGYDSILCIEDGTFGWSIGVFDTNAITIIE